MAFSSCKDQNNHIFLFPISDQSIKPFIVSYAKERGSYTLVFATPLVVQCRVLAPELS